MKRVHVAIRTEECIGAGNCSRVAPEVFDHDDDGIALIRPGCEVVDVSAALREAVMLCPVGAVVVTEASE